MVEEIDIDPIIDRLQVEFSSLIEEREENRIQLGALQKRADEIERKLKGIEKTLQGFSLYSSAQTEPTALLKKTTRSLAEMLAGMQGALTGISIAGPEVPKTLTECCRDILRQKNERMSAVEVREALLAAGFDFSNYTSNPLSSIHTTLKRLVPDEVEVEITPDGTTYRWKAGGQ
jgi:hypothetical protein